MSYIKTINFSAHAIFNDSEVRLKNKRRTEGSNFITLLIGENGTGKSEFLKEIVEYFRLREQSKGKAISKFVRIDTPIDKNNKWPEKLIASSFSLNDKFPFLNKDAEEKNKGFYRYLGIRTASNNAFTGKMRDELFHCMVKICANPSRLRIFKEIINDFGLPLNYKFDFSQSRGVEELFENSRQKSVVTLSAIVKDMVDSFKISNRFAPSTLIKMQDDVILKKDVLRKINKTFKDTEKNISINFDLDEMLEVGLPKNAHEVDYVLKSRLITLTDFSPGGNIKFQHLSSGQFHLLKSIITLMAELENSSLILIDEPEISLHPSWQINYMSVLNKMISQFYNCHVVVATHSHLIVTTLPLKNSDVIVARKNKINGQIFFSSLDGSPSGWSADMILYSVFGVLNKNNQSFDYDVKFVASSMSNWTQTSENIKKLREAVLRLSQYKLPDADPLSKFIVQSEIFLSKVENETL